MGTYDRYTGIRTDWTTAYVADPHFYRRPDGTPFGVFALNEGLETIVPMMPSERYHADGEPVREWRFLLYSRTKGDVIGDTDFYEAMRRLSEGGYFLDDNGGNVLIQALSLAELDALMR